MVLSGIFCNSISCVQRLGEAAAAGPHGLDTNMFGAKELCINTTKWEEF